MISNTTTTTTIASNNMRQVITFNPRVSCRYTMSIEDYTASEVSKSWYSEKEMGRITERCFKLLKRMNAGKADKYCIRGLEGHSTVGNISKKKNRASAIAAVLMEQAQQWVENTINEHAIADAYRRTTSTCQMWAQVVGMRDQQAAEMILFEEEEEEGLACNQPYSTTTSGAACYVVKKELSTNTITGKPTSSASTGQTSLMNPGGKIKLHKMFKPNVVTYAVSAHLI